MRAIHEIRTKEPLCEDHVGAHRDASILNGIIVSQMPDIEMENESWINEEKYKRNKKISWEEIPNHKVRFVCCNEPMNILYITVSFLDNLSSCNVTGVSQV